MWLVLLILLLLFVFLFFDNNLFFLFGLLLLTFALFLLSFFVRLWGFLGWGLDCRNADFDAELCDYLLHVGSLISVAKEKLPSFWS